MMCETKPKLQHNRKCASEAGSVLLSVSFFEEREKLQDSAQVRERGWQRIALFSLFFQPGGLDIIPWSQACSLSSLRPHTLVA
jgi:hypothetical protein